MKKLLLIAILGLFSVIRVSAQNTPEQKQQLKDKDVPQAVRDALDKQYDNATMVEWKLKDGKYVAHFNQDAKKYMVELSQSGEVLAKGEKIDKADLPAPVAEAIKTAYASEKTDNIYKIERDGQVQYAVKVEGNPKKKVIYDANGKVLKEKTFQ